MVLATALGSIMDFVYSTNFNLGKWKKYVENQRSFFEQIAKEKNFDPYFQPEMWANITRHDLTKHKVL